MEEVLQYLGLKNEYYQRFYKMTVDFVEKVKLNQWEDLEFFVKNRERVINIIRTFDFKIAKIFQHLDISQYNLEDYRPRIKAFFERRSDIVEKIVQLDLFLISKLDAMKTETIRELKESIELEQCLSSFSKNSAREIET